MTNNISPFAPKGFPYLPPIKGIELAVAEAGIKYKARTDLLVIKCSAGTEIAGVFTKNKAPGSPVVWSRKALEYPVSSQDPRLIVINSGTANVFCGAKGKAAVLETAQGAAKNFGGKVENVFLSSTGVIGQPLDASKITRCFTEMSLSEDLWESAARAIMTTDTFAKGSTIETKIQGKAVRINGIAKGSGMIAPDMATMLSYIFTDAKIGKSALQRILSDISNTTFNAITVDSDTSTSDTVLLGASGKAENPLITNADDPAMDEFKSALHTLMLDLAQQIIKDGEGASKFITVKVTRAVSDESAKNIAMSIANSPLVKTAIAGEDANWGRIVMAVGKAGEPADRDKLTIKMGPHLLAENGSPSPSYTEKDGSAYMREPYIDISVDLGLANGEFTVWTCDLTHRYIEINADYRS